MNRINILNKFSFLLISCMLTTTIVELSAYIKGTYIREADFYLALFFALFYCIISLFSGNLNKWSFYKINEKILFGICIVLISLLTRIYCGVYIHDEYGDDSFFVKYRPTWKWEFYSPVGQSDLKIEDLPPDKQIEQKYFDEFVTNQGLSR